MTGDLSGVDQKISDWSMKMIFLVEVETAVKSGVKSGFGVVAFGTRDAIWGPWFLFRKSPL